MTSTADLARMRPSPPMTHEQALDAICGCSATVTVLSYQEAIGAYFKLRDLGDPAVQNSLLDRIAELEGEREIQRIELIRSDNRADALYHRALAAEAQVSALQAQVDGLRERWRPEVAAFADLMETKLRENDHKGGWKDCSAGWLCRRLHQEVDELFEAVSRLLSYDTDDRGARVNHRLAVGSEAADVANFAMMIADVCGALSQPPADEAAKGEG